MTCRHASNYRELEVMVTFKVKPSPLTELHKKHLVQEWARSKGATVLEDGKILL